MTQNLSHLNQQGEVHMVDVGDRPATQREAHARGHDADGDIAHCASVCCETTVGGELKRSFRIIKALSETLRP